MKSTFTPKVRMESIGNLTGAPFNPVSRTEKRKLQKIIEGIREVGGIVQPIVVSKDLQIIDGHRRAAAAKVLGMTEVPVIVSPLSLQVGWRVLNETSLPVYKKDWVQIHYHGVSLENVPPSPRREISTIKQLIGEDGFAELAALEMSSGVVSEARYVAKYIEGKDRREKPSEEMHREVLLWMIELNQQAHAKAAVKSEMDPDVLKFSVLNRKRIHK